MADDRKREPLAYRPTKRAVVRELVSLACLACVLATASIYWHYRLPTPLAPTTPLAPKPRGHASDAWFDALLSHQLDGGAASAYELADGEAYDGPLSSYFSEANAMLTMQHLSEGIGYRVVGTQKHVDAEVWLEDVLRRYEGTHATGGSEYATHVEVFRQQSDGRHRFEILGHPVWKRYYGMSNLIVRVSDGSEESKAHTLLVNAHIDSTIPSPGAVDDAAGVAIMLEALRALTVRGAPRMKHGLVLLFNNGEESLQDASHLYMTQENITRASVRAVVNLEGCGVSGPPLLFQATDPALIEAYSRVPHPFGTVVASDVFSSGIIMSDTDFRQFQEYGHGLPGLDMAVVGSSYLYHTRRDVPSYVERGVLQHFGENTLSLIESLCLDAASPLAQIRRRPFQRLLPVYFSIASSYMIVLSPHLFKNIITSLSVLVNFLLSAMNSTEPRTAFVRMAMISTIGIVGNYVAALVAANAVAFVLRCIAPLSWFGHEFYALALFVPPALTAIVGVQRWIHSLPERTRRPYLEYSSFAGAIIFHTFMALLMNFYLLGSAHVAVLIVLASLVPLIVNDYLVLGLSRISSGLAPDTRLHFSTYPLHLLLPCTIGVEAVVSFLDLLVPLMGRMGTHVPVDHVMGSLVAVLVCIVASVVTPLCHRYGPASMRKTMWVGLGVTCATAALFAAQGLPVFDDRHPRRLLLHHVENVTSGEWHVAHSVLDSASRDRRLDAAIERTLLGDAPNASLSWDHAAQAAPDMDILFPLTHFIDVTRVTLPSTPTRQALSRDTSRWADVRLSCKDLHYDAANHTRHVLLRLEHPYLAWSTLSFDADIVEWDFDEPPPTGMQRHHLKDVSRYGERVFEMRLALRTDEWPPLPVPSDSLRQATVPRGRFQVHVSGLDAHGMYPHHKDVSMDRLSMQTLGALDDMLRRDFPGIDPMLVSIIGGVGVC